MCRCGCVGVWVCGCACYSLGLIFFFLLHPDGQLHKVGGDVCVDDPLPYDLRGGLVIGGGCSRYVAGGAMMI